MKFLVDIKDTSYATIEVNADSKEEAEQIAMAEYYAGNIGWDDCDIDLDVRKKEQNRGER